MKPRTDFSRDEIVTYFEKYVGRFHLPVLYGVHVKAVLPKTHGDGYVVETSICRFGMKNVVIATGLYQKPKLPAFSADSPAEIKQIYPDEYRNPQSVLGNAAGCLPRLPTDDCDTQRLFARKL